MDRRIRYQQALLWREIRRLARHRQRPAEQGDPHSADQAATGRKHRVEPSSSLADDEAPGFT